MIRVKNVAYSPPRMGWLVCGGDTKDGGMVLVAYDHDYDMAGDQRLSVAEHKNIRLVGTFFERSARG